MQESQMRDTYSIRLSNTEKDLLQQNHKKFGFKSRSDFARALIKIGFKSLKITHKEKHVLHNSAQSVMLLREVVSLLSGNVEQSSQLIEDVKKSAEDWTSKFEKLLHRQ
jgi:hypothetical protein